MLIYDGFMLPWLVIIDVKRSRVALASLWFDTSRGCIQQYSACRGAAKQESSLYKKDPHISLVNRYS